MNRLRSYWPVLLALVLGVALRLSFGQDIEFKGDEAQMVNHVRDFLSGGRWPQLGIVSSGGMRNPGLSVWIFQALGWIFHVDSPVGLARVVQGLNCLALLLLAFLSIRIVEDRNRESWLWALALVCVNPVEVVLERKIWAQSITPIFIVLCWIAWWKRDKWWAALSWGWLSWCIGQIHMAGFFTAAGVALWTAVFEKTPRKTCWRAWLIGSVLSWVMLIPWVIHLWSMYQGGQTTLNAPHSWLRLIMFKFWTLWFVVPVGTTSSYSLGSQFYDFLRYPLVGSLPTFLMGVAHSILLLGTAWVFFIWLRTLLAEREKLQWRSLDWNQKPTLFLLGGGGIATGVLMTLARVPMQLHYMLLLFPLPFVWFAHWTLAKVRGGRKLLAIFFFCQLMASVTLLYYLHVNGGAARGDYGVAYSAQVRAAH